MSNKLFFLRLRSRVNQCAHGVHSASSMSSKEIRKSFLDYFVTKGHTLVPSLLSYFPILTKMPVTAISNKQADFIFSGVQQFSDIVNGVKRPVAVRVANSQKCIRLGGAHIRDVELVGEDNYHHTFFEMLGNWSFGDYYKEEACAFAWEYLTKILKIDKKRLYVTYFHGDAAIKPDEETRDIWHRIGVPSSHVVGFGPEHNFWKMGTTGPCGPCTEIHIDKLDRDENVAGMLNMDDPSLVELWNVVFMEWNRMPDNSLVPLATKNIDTGLGFERLCAILQQCESAYETDLFQPLLQLIEQLSGHKHNYSGRIGGHDKDGIDAAYRIVSDHMRTVVVAMADGVRFSEERRKKNVRKIKELFKRATIHGVEHLGMERMSMAKFVPIIVEKLGDTYPELQRNQNRITEGIKAEEQYLWKQRDEGIAHLEEMFRHHPPNCSVFPGRLAYAIVRNYRIEFELVKRMAAQRNLTIDEQEFQRIYTQKTVGNNDLGERQCTFG